jgi:hypothetical protein
LSVRSLRPWGAEYSLSAETIAIHLLPISLYHAPLIYNDQAAEIVWGTFEGTLRTLYLEQDLSLAEVMHEMATKHQFNAT